MTTSAKELIDLETKFWQSLVDKDADAALPLLHEPSIMATVAARDGGKSTTQDMVDTSTWVYVDKRWQCALHTESPLEEKEKKPAKS